MANYLIDISNADLPQSDIQAFSWLFGTETINVSLRWPSEMQEIRNTWDNLVDTFVKGQSLINNKGASIKEYDVVQYMESLPTNLQTYVDDWAVDESVYLPSTIVSSTAGLRAGLLDDMRTRILSLQTMKGYIDENLTWTGYLEDSQGNRVSITWLDKARYECGGVTITLNVPTIDDYMGRLSNSTVEGEI